MKLVTGVLMASLMCGCTVAKISGRGPSPLILNSPSQKSELIVHFTASKRITFDYTSAFDVSDLVTDELKKYPQGDAVTNLTINIRSEASDFFINLFTLGFAASKTFQVEGDIVKLGGRAGQVMRDGTVLGKAAPGAPLSAQLPDFAGAPSESPIVVRAGEELVLVRR